MSARVKVTINGRTVEVAPGTLVTDAARAAEVHIPVFCSHPKLPPLGACRICLVEIGMPKKDREGKPVMGADGNPEIAWVPKPQTACTTPVAEGMVVATDSPVAVKARKGVMEFLLVNHPLDCPVCDEGGECQLQDLAFAFGTDFSRMDQRKRTFVSEHLGPVVKKEANRCIVCMRCVRYCDQVMGEDALTAECAPRSPRSTASRSSASSAGTASRCVRSARSRRCPTGSRPVRGISGSTSPSARGARTAARCGWGCAGWRSCVRGAPSTAA
jgi:NADH dehydrogenase/NADH:ubiquinone oxidoreductase subunit G